MNDETAPERLPLKVLVVALRHAYANPSRGLSFEHYNLLLPMGAVAADVSSFEYDSVMGQLGRAGMHRELVDTVRQNRPDVALFALAGEEFSPEVIAEVRKYTTAVTYFFDDVWRLDFVSRWAPRFDYFTTPSWAMWRQYRASGNERAIYSPFGFNSLLYSRPDIPISRDVSFVGGAHPWREFVMRRLQSADIRAQAFGDFWPAGRVSQQSMIEIFAGSRINLNISNARQWDGRYLVSSWRGIRNTLRTAKHRDGTKARHFEIPACGGFQLSYYCEDLERHFAIGDEVAIYLDLDELIDKVRYYLENDGERQRVAEAGYLRARRDHSMEQRLSQLLTTVTRP